MAASWECPSLPMLSLPLKETGKTSFLGLKPLIGAHYEENPDSFSDEIRQLDQLREHSMKPTRDYNGCSVLRRYFAQLHLLRARFPPETVGQIPVDFAWRDVYSGAEYIQEGFQIEQASVLYNVAALHSQLGSHGKRDSEQEMKEAVTHFQCSAGALAYLDEHFAINHASKDLSAEFVSFNNSLMLGQAQECLVEKSLKGIGRVKNVTISRLATRVSEFYSRCTSLLEGGACAVIAKKNKDWPKLLKFKVFYYHSIAHYYQGAHAEEMGKYGELIALLQLTVQKLNSITGKPPKGMGDMMKTARQNFADHVTDKLTVARRQNEQVYHDTVPPVESLELTSGADLVKPVSFHPTDPKNLGTDIFSRLIPMRAHEVASIFSEEKAKLMRSIMSSVEEKDEELQQYMKSLNATEVEKIHEESPTIPENVLRLHQSLQGRVEEVRKLHASCQELIAMSRSVEEDFAAIRETKKTEEEEEEKFQSQFGARQASQVCSGMWKEMDNYHGYNLQALKSNTELKAMFDQHYPNLVLLTSPLASLKASLPKMTLLDAPAEEASESERWQHLLKEVEKMTQQRQVLVARFRQQMSSDDITKNLVGHLGNDQEVFLEDNMKQFKEVAAIIRQNLTAQENILTALTEANAKKASTRQTVQEIAQQQQAMFAGLVKSGGFLKLLQTKIQEGIVFYQKLQASVSRLRKRSAEVCEARRRERQNMERQRASTAPDGASPNAPPATPQPAAAPTRPPKKAELAGRPIPPDQQGLPPVHGDSATDSSSGANTTPLNAHQPPLKPLDLQELQKVQMQQQQALLGGPKSPPPSEPLQLGDTNPPNIVPNENQPSDAQSPLAPQAPLLPPVLVPDAAQALNSLQMLLQPNSQTPQQPIEPGGVGGTEGSTAPDPSLVPQRPPKPDHLKSGLLPSPFPSLPPPAEEQTTQPSVIGLAEPHPSQLPETHTVNGPGVDAGIPQTGLYPDSMTGNPTSIPTDPLPGNQVATGFPSQSLQQPLSEAPPHTTSSVVWTTVTTGGGGGDGRAPLSPPATTTQPPVTAEDGTSMHPVSHQDLTLSQTQSVVPLSPPYHQTNINIQPGEVTVATSSILGPIPSALAMPRDAVPASFNATSAPSDLGVPAPPMQPALGALPAADAGEQAPTAMNLQNFRDTFASGSESLQTSNNPPGVANTGPIHSQYTQPQDETVTSNSIQADTPASNVIEDATAPAGSDDQRDLSEPQLTSIVPSVSGNSPQVSLQIPQTGPSLQTVTLPEIESQPGSHRSTTAADPPVAFAARTITDLSSFSMLGSTNANLATTMPTTSSASAPTPTTAFTGVSTPSEVPASAPVPSTLPGSAPLPSAILTGTEIPPSVPPVGIHNLPSVVPLPLTTLGPLAAPLETPTDSIPVATELMLESLAPQQQSLAFQQVQSLQQKLEDQKRLIETYRAEKEAHMKQEVAYQQQIAQLQQQLHMMQLKQDQEKAAASDQQSKLMKLLHQQQDMFSQQQNQMEKLSQQDESHRKEYLHVEEKFRESLRVEQEMKVSLQSQILQLTQENQKLSQTIQTQSQQVQALQLQLQQYNIHIQERDKQLVAFKDQHKEIVDKLEQRSQQRVAQLVQRVQELQLQLNQRPMLPQPLQPAVVPQPPQQLQRQNPQQSQDLGPPGLQQRNLPQPLQPNVPHPQRPPHTPLQHPGMQEPTSTPPRPHQTSAIQQPPPPQAMPVPRPQTAPPTADPRMANMPSMRPPSSQQQQQPLQTPMVPMQMHPQNMLRPGSSPVAPSSQPPSAMQQHRPQAPQHQAHMQPNTAHMQPGQMRGGSLPSSQQAPQPSGGHHSQPQAMPQSTPQTPSTPGGMGTLHPVSHSGTPPQPSRPVSHPSLQSQASYPGIPVQQQQQQQQQPQMHLQPGSGHVFHSPSDPSLRPVPPQQQAMIPRPMAQQPLQPQLQPQQQMMGPRFPPQGGQMMGPGAAAIPGAQQHVQPLPTSVGQLPYGGSSVPRGPAGLHPHHPQYHGRAP